MEYKNKILMGITYLIRVSFSLGTITDQIFQIISNLLILAGTFIIIWGLLTVICGSGSKGIKTMVIGVILLIIGGMIVSFSLNNYMFNFFERDPTLSRGYQ
ncbi:MAG: hypothetical protein ACTSWE_06700 [Promethearchaeota archaeon]